MGERGWNFGLTKISCVPPQLSICNLFRGERVCTQELVAMSKKKLQVHRSAVMEALCEMTTRSRQK